MDERLRPGSNLWTIAGPWLALTLIDVAPSPAIGFAEGLGKTTLTPGRLQRGTKNLTEDANYAFSRLSQNHGVTRIEFREQIHMIKRNENLPADFTYPSVRPAMSGTRELAS